tara:strand:- start:1540 stop:2127 length:588 start_codon:yes stop_codon:yes gene_type:complete
MIVVGILGDIGSGKSFVSKLFKCPVFNADIEVNKIYRNNNNCYRKIKRKLPRYIKTFPINKAQLSRAILANNNNLKKIVTVVHPIVRKKMNVFIKKNVKKKIVVLDVPLLIENNLNKKKDVLIFVDSKKKQIDLRLKKRKNYNKKIIESFRKLQKKLSHKKKISDYIIKNDFKLLTIKKSVKLIKEKILYERNSS